jgi:hypothetical protein
MLPTHTWLRGVEPMSSSTPRTPPQSKAHRMIPVGADDLSVICPVTEPSDDSCGDRLAELRGSKDSLVPWARSRRES